MLCMPWCNGVTGKSCENNHLKNCEARTLNMREASKCKYKKYVCINQLHTHMAFNKLFNLL